MIGITTPARRSALGRTRIGCTTHRRPACRRCWVCLGHQQGQYLRWCLPRSYLWHRILRRGQRHSGDGYRGRVVDMPDRSSLEECYRRELRVPPCGRCREFIRQMHEENGETDVILGRDTVVKLRELLPHPPGTIVQFRQAAPIRRG